MVDTEKFKRVLSDVCFDSRSGNWKAVDGFDASCYWYLIIEIIGVGFTSCYSP